jgi:UDP-GlcNAc:undecaprenyl-phosphate GlcNAc-1-phosphate transferase
LTFPANVYLLASAGAFFTAALSLPLWQRWCWRIGLVDEPGHRKIHDRPTPLSGGLAVMTGMLLPILLACLVLWVYSRQTAVTSAGQSSPPAQPGAASILDVPSVRLLQHGLNRRALELAAILAGAAGMLILGLLDDKHELSARAKFIGQVGISAMVAGAGVRITLFVPSLVFSYTITVLWILTIINAFNFMDNMNGLCTGLGVIGAWHFALIASAEGQYLVALTAFLTFGALLGFLPYNFPRARAFLGDSGSHLVGYLLAVLAILPHFYSSYHPRRLAVFVPLLVLGIPLFDLVWVVFLRWRLGRPFYQGDTNHLSHRLVRLGLSQTRAVLVIWLLAAALGTIACWW